MTADTLKSKSVKDLAEMAKKRGIAGWHAMRKEDLVKALLRLVRKTANGHAPKGTPSSLASATRRATAPAMNGAARSMTAKSSEAQRDAKDKKVSLAAKKILLARLKQDRMKDLAWRTTENKKGAIVRDRLVVMVRDAFWLHCYWELSRHGVERAQAALAQDWHTAKPVLRLSHVVEGGATSAAETVIRDIDIHGGVTNWYIEVQDPPRSFRVEIGYRATNGRFHMLARSNIVTTPRPDSKDSLDHNWNAVAEDYDKIYALSGGYSPDGHSVELQELFEERLRRPMGSPMVTGFGSGVEGLVPRRKDFHFEVDAEVIVFGTTEPTAHVTLQGEPVKVRPDGTFTVRFAMPNARQVIPAVASSIDGLEQRTVVLAIERNTKVMEPVVKDSSDCSS